MEHVEEINGNKPKQGSILLRINMGVIGPRKCGKTSLIKSFISKTFNPSLQEETIFNIHKLIITINNTKHIEMIITEITIDDELNVNLETESKEVEKETKIDYKKYSQELIKSMDVIILCYEMKENEDDFKEEEIKKQIEYINNISYKNFVLYLVGCKLDQKIIDLGDDNINIYQKEMSTELTKFGLQIKKFVEENKIKKYLETSSLLNFNINDLFEHAIIHGTYAIYKNYFKRRNSGLYIENSNILDEIGEPELINEEEFLEKCTIF